MLHHKPLIALALATLLPAAACHHDHGSPAEDACIHMKDGPSAAITAAAEASADAPRVHAQHTRFDVTLAGDAGELGGHVNLFIEDAAEHIVFLSAAVPITVRNAQGAELTATEVIEDVSECEEVVVGRGYELGVGTYPLQIGPTAESLVRIVVVAEDDHDH